MLGTLIVLVGIGTVFFMSAEGLTFVDACYMSTATIATVGYGDISPMTESGRVFAIFWIMSGYSILVRSLHHLLDTNHTQTLERKRAKLLNRDLSRKSILNMDKDGDGTLSRLEFVTHMIVALKLCTPLHLRKIMERFDEIEQSRVARKRVMQVMNDVKKFSRQTPLKGKLALPAGKNWLKAIDAASKETGIEKRSNDALGLMGRALVSRTDASAAPPALRHHKEPFSRSPGAEEATAAAVKTKAPAELSPNEWALSMPVVGGRRSPHRSSSGIAMRRTSSMMVREAIVQRQYDKQKRSSWTRQQIVTDKTHTQAQAEQVETKVDAAANKSLAPAASAVGGATKSAGRSVVIDVASRSGSPHVAGGPREIEGEMRGGSGGGEAESESPSIDSDGSNGNNSSTIALDVSDGDAAALYEREHPLSAMLAHLRRASELAREHVHAEARQGNVQEAKAAVRCYRHLLESLHTQQAYALDRLSDDDPEWRRCSPHRERQPKLSNKLNDAS